MFEKILVCLDGSKLAEQILPYVEAQAVQFASTVTLIQIISISKATLLGSGVTPAPTDIITEQLQIDEKQAREYLQKIARQLEMKGIKTETATPQGINAGEDIIDYAKSNGISLIAIATHGRSGFGRAVFGSIADYILRNTSLPLLVIKPN
jgi:nucleotide-binding universal stress UspA family protein